MNHLKETEFYFVRHGETDWNREFRGMGQMDIPLNSRGVDQAFHAADILGLEPQIKTICHSPLSRCRATAEIIGAQLKCTLIEMPALIECCWGQNEGLVKGDWVEDWRQGQSIPGAEPYAEFLRRALAGINDALARPGPVLVVSHGGVFWAVQHFGRLGSQIDLKNGVPVLLRPPSRNGLPWIAMPLGAEEPF